MSHIPGDEMKLALDEGRLTYDLSQKLNIVTFTNHEANLINAKPFLPIFPPTAQTHTEKISGLPEDTNRE